MAKKVNIYNSNGKLIKTCSSCIETSVAIRTIYGQNIHNSLVGKICNYHAPQRLDYTLTWFDPTSETIHHGNCQGISCISHGDDFHSMQMAADTFGATMDAVKAAVTTNEPLKYKGKVILLEGKPIILCKMEQTSKHTTQLMDTVHELRTENAKLRKRIEEHDRKQAERDKAKAEAKAAISKCKSLGVSIDELI